MVFCSLERQRRLVQTKVYYKHFYSVWKDSFQKLLKVEPAEKFLPSVYIIDTTCFDECFLLRVIIERHYFLYKFIITLRYGATDMLVRSLKQVLWKKSAFYIRCFHNVAQNKAKASNSWNNLTKFICWSSHRRCSVKKGVLRNYDVNDVFLMFLLLTLNIFHIFF